MESLPCKHLRTKRLFIPDLALDGPGVPAPMPQREAVCQCWCTRTMTALGLDQRHVTPRTCTDPQRPCYRPF